MRLIKTYCEDERRSHAGLLLVKELVAKRPPRRMQFVRVLLDLSSFRIEKVFARRVTSTFPWRHRSWSWLVPLRIYHSLTIALYCQFCLFIRTDLILHLSQFVVKNEIWKYIYTSNPILIIGIILLGKIQECSKPYYVVKMSLILP